MILDYQSPEAHVAMRDGLPSAIRPTLLEEASQDWQAHPRFAGKARFFMDIHRQLLDGADWMADTVETLLDPPESELIDRIAAARLPGNARRLIGFAHGHHEIEDHGYFPQFKLIYPQLDRAMALLDGDHKVLDEALNGTETALKELKMTPTRDRLSGLYKGVAALKKIMHRHITDEEEVIIPIFLRHG